MTKRRGNPNWGKSLDISPPMPVSLCGWDLLLYRLNVKEADAASHPAVQAYIRRHYRSRFVPEKVLETCGIESDFLLH